MTYRTLLKELAKTKGWCLTKGAAIRQKDRLKSGGHCPLSMVAAKVLKKQHHHDPNRVCLDVERSTKVLHINLDLANDIAEAADFNFYTLSRIGSIAQADIRRDLLKACHLKEDK